MAKWTSPNQFLVELDSNTTNKNPGPIRAVVRGFSQYRDQMQSLDLIEMIKLRVITDFIVGSFDVGSLPITGIHVVGHADTDFQRGRRFEEEISETRAKNVQAYLKKEVDRKPWTFSLEMPRPPIPGVRTTAMIDWKVPRGVGATQPDPENVKLRRTPQNMTEADRKRNRRVEIVLEPGDYPTPGLDSDGIRKAVTDIYHVTVPIPPATPPLDWRIFDRNIMPKPLDTGGWFKYYEWTQDWFQSHHIDPDPFLDWMKDIVFPNTDWPTDEDSAKDLKNGRPLEPLR